MGGQLCNKRELGETFLGGGDEATSFRPSPSLLSRNGVRDPGSKICSGSPRPRGTHRGAGSALRDARTDGRTDGAAAALTRFLRRRRFCEVGARLLQQRLLALALLRVDVLGLRLLAPRHGARIGAPGRALVTCHQFLELGNFTPLRPERACPSNYYYQ